MAFLECHYYSPALGRQVAANILCPQSKKGPFPVLYLLHCLSDDYFTWMRRSRIERHVDGLPLIVVMPDGGRGFYIDAGDGSKYESAIVHDLVGAVDRMFQTRAEPGGRGVGGVSMGGYGALKFAIRFPEIFGSATAHSAPANFGHDFRLNNAELLQHEAEFRHLLDDQWSGGPNDIYRLATEADPARWPALRFDCGTEDFLLEDSRQFHTHLEKLNLPHEYAEFPGDHEWDYWDLHIREALAFHCQRFGIPYPPPKPPPAGKKL